MINEKNLINDGLTVNSNGTCVNNGQNTWSYNQGVILGGLVELSCASGNTSLLTDVTTITKAALALVSDAQGIIHESNRCEHFCGSDGSQLKGIFVRNLNYLHAMAPQDAFRSAIMANAESIWRNNCDGSNRLGINWSGPASAGAETKCFDA
jgi:predicted alpha-1,6-mannanase (GH76 family)